MYQLLLYIAESVEMFSDSSHLEENVFKIVGSSRALMRLKEDFVGVCGFLIKCRANL